MKRQPTRYTRTDTRFPYTTLVRSDWGLGIGDRQTRSAGDPASPCLDASGMSEKTTASGGVLAKVAAYPAVALVLQGGGALGAYQCGVYQGLHEAGIRPNWLAGISIGAINAAIIEIGRAHV